MQLSLHATPYGQTPSDETGTRVQYGINHNVLRPEDAYQLSAPVVVYVCVVGGSPVVLL